MCKDLLQRPFDELTQTNSHLQHVLAKVCGGDVETTLSALHFSRSFMWQRSWECVWISPHCLGYRNKGPDSPIRHPLCICVPWAGRTGHTILWCREQIMRKTQIVSSSGYAPQYSSYRTWMSANMCPTTLQQQVDFYFLVMWVAGAIGVPETD